MTNSKATKKALFMSMLSLLLCFTMLMGATFAWFTDTVTSKNNIIKSGNLDVEMYWADGDEDPANATWQDASADAIFDYQNWEPGYVQARHLKIKNVGSLALKYQLRILADGIVSKLANVIDVYYVETAKQLTRDNINNPQTPVVKLGTLSEVLNNTNANALTKTVVGMLEANKGIDSERTLTLAFKMQESAGNEYQNLSIGSEFRVELLATQVEAEVDSFDDTYDKEADFAPQETPSAMVSELSGSDLKINATAGIGGAAESMELDAGYRFEPTETKEQGAASKYAKYHVDFVVSADQKVPANSLALAGYYDAWCQYNNDNWVAMMSDADILANTEIRLVETLGATVNYEEICQYGNDGIGFQCGIAELIDGANSGTTITVELRMYETEEPSDSNGGSANVETGNYTILGTFTHTFDKKEYSMMETNIGGVTVKMSEPAVDSIVYHDRTGYTDKVRDITVYTKEDMQAVVALRAAGVMVHNGANDIVANMIFGDNIDFGGASFAGLSKGINVQGNGYILSNVKFIAGNDGKAGFIPYAGNNVIENLTIKDVTVEGAQAGVFAGNASNVTLTNCAVAGNVNIKFVASATEEYNGVGVAFGVNAEGNSKIDVDVSNANINIVKDGITYPTGNAEETSTNLVGVVYGGSYTINN